MPATVLTVSKQDNNLNLHDSEWMTVKEACEYSRFSKALIYGLINRGLIRSVSLRERGHIKGKRTISADSLRKFLHSKSSGGENQTPTK